MERKDTHLICIFHSGTSTNTYDSRLTMRVTHCNDNMYPLWRYPPTPQVPPRKGPQNPKNPKMSKIPFCAYIRGQKTIFCTFLSIFGIFGFFGVLGSPDPHF